MLDNLPPYFNQNLNWVKFWKEANNSNHDFWCFTDTGCWNSTDLPADTDDFKIKAFVYEYPWFLGQKFWYIPKGPIIDQSLNFNQVKTLFKSLLQTIIQQARIQNISHLKFDFDDTFTTFLNLQNNSQLEVFLESLNLDLQIRNETKPIQYLQSMTMDVSRIKTQDFETVTKPDLQSFFDTNIEFWNQTSQKVRRYTRRSLELYQKGEWQVSFDKTEANFELFWQIHSQTASKKEFATSSKEYLNQLFQQDFSRLILILDKDGSPHSVWLGVNLNQTLVYIFGGNTKRSLEDNAQYLLQLAAVYLAANEKLQQYDLGGYKASEGYGQFKDPYKGRIRSFIGPVDLVFKSKVYNLINWLVGLKKMIGK